jgi:hypothetical protein
MEMAIVMCRRGGAIWKRLGSVGVAVFHDSNVAPVLDGDRGDILWWPNSEGKRVVVALTREEEGSGISVKIW